MSRMTKVAVVAVVVVGLGAGVYASVVRNRSDAPAVTIEPLQIRKLEALVSASGKVQAKRFVNISADTSGRVTQVGVEEGDRVRAGQFLLQIDPRNLQTRVQSSEASARAAQSQAAQLEVSLSSARVALKQSEDAARRQRDLWSRGLTTKETLDRADNDLSLRQSDVRSAEQQIRTQQLRADQEQATLENAKTDLAKVRIESPIDGIVTKRNIEEGETAIVGTMNNAGTVLLTIADMSIIEAEVEVDETDIPSVKLGQPASIAIDAMPGRTFPGHVTEIGNSPIETTSGSTSTQATNFKVVVTLDAHIPDVRPGFTCTADITTATREHALAIPIQATTVREVPQQRKEVEGVFVEKDGRAIFTPITTGIAGDKYFESLTGVHAGDRVITGPFSVVREIKDGTAVRLDATKGSGR